MLLTSICHKLNVSLSKEYSEIKNIFNSSCLPAMAITEEKTFQKWTSYIKCCLANLTDKQVSALSKRKYFNLAYFKPF